MIISNQWEEKVNIGAMRTNDGVGTIQVEFFDGFWLREFCGTVGQNITVLQKNIGIDIVQNGDGVLLRGSRDLLPKAVAILHQLFALIEHGYTLRVAEVDQASRMLLQEPEVNLVKLCKETIFVGQRKKRIFPRSIRQSQYFRAIRQNDLVFGVGPAGTGKTYLAMAMALSALLKEEVKKIILCRPAVEAGEKLGFLPGDMLEKVNPYLRPLYDALFDLVGIEKAERFIDRNIIEVAPLAFMRGRTLSDAFVILDEAQNTTQEQMKMFLTRIGLGSKAVVTGDPSQVDLPRNQKSGLIQALSILKEVQGIGIVELTDADVVRHPLVSAIIRAYAKEGKT